MHLIVEGQSTRAGFGTACCNTTLWEFGLRRRADEQLPQLAVESGRRVSSAGRMGRRMYARLRVLSNAGLVIKILLAGRQIIQFDLYCFLHETSTV